MYERPELITAIDMGFQLLAAVIAFIIASLRNTPSYPWVAIGTASFLRVIILADNLNTFIEPSIKSYMRLGVSVLMAGAIISIFLLIITKNQQ